MSRSSQTHYCYRSSRSRGERRRPKRWVENGIELNEKDVIISEPKIVVKKIQNIRHTDMEIDDRLYRLSHVYSEVSHNTDDAAKMVIAHCHRERCNEELEFFQMHKRRRWQFENLPLFLPSLEPFLNLLFAVFLWRCLMWEKEIVWTYLRSLCSMFIQWRLSCVLRGNSNLVFF